MGYRIFICRANRPEQASQDPISLEEWKSVVRDIPEMRLYEGEDALPPHIKAPEASEGMARWAGHPRFESVWFNHQDGVVYVEGYDAYVNMRMRVLANRLNATVMDKNGRTF